MIINSQYSPAIVDVDSSSEYEYDATSDLWKELCSGLPCDRLMHWPQYRTAFLKTTVGGKPAVIQCWKGYCEEFLPSFPDDGGRISFPGGVGAEVGIYRTDDLPYTPKLPPIDDAWPEHLQTAADAWFKLRKLKFSFAPLVEPWWPANDLFANGKPVNTQPGDQAPFVSFTLSDSKHGEILIDSYGTDSYWTCKWMHPLSFAKWCGAWAVKHPEFDIAGHKFALPPEPASFDLNFRVGNQNYAWKGNSTNIVRVAAPAAAAPVVPPLASA